MASGHLQIRKNRFFVEALRIQTLKRGVMKLEDYFEAYDRAHTLAGDSPEWGAMRKKIRWALARPILELTGQFAFLLGCLALGIWGNPIGYLLALGTLCFIPQYVGNLRAQIASVRVLSGTEELQRYLGEEAQRRMAGAVVGTIYYAALALLFLGAGAVAAWRGKDFSPGLIAGLLVGALCVHALFFRLPRASREIAILEREKLESEAREEDLRGN